MDDAAIDFPALILATLIALVITVTLWVAQRNNNNRRGWMAAAALAGVLLAIGLADVLRETPRQTHLATVFFGVPLPLLGAMGMIRATRQVRDRFRWPMVFVTTLVLLLGGLMIGATVWPKYFS